MTLVSSGNYVVFLVGYVIGIIAATPVMVRNDAKNVKYEEYIIEHEISATQARNVALSTDENAILLPAACAECTKEENSYCLSSDLISDHCCCDKRFHEYLPYIPHTCYFGTQLCTTVALDCNKYSVLRSCCCDKYLLQKWKEKYGYSHAVKNKVALTLLLLSLTVMNLNL